MCGHTLFNATLFPDRQLVISVESAVVRSDVLGHAIHNPCWWLGLLLVCAAVVVLASGLVTPSVSGFSAVSVVFLVTVSAKVTGRSPENQALFIFWIK